MNKKDYLSALSNLLSIPPVHRQALPPRLPAQIIEILEAHAVVHAAFEACEAFAQARLRDEDE